MKINLVSFLLGVIFMMSFFLFTGGVFMPKHLKVSSIEILDQGDNKSGYIIIKNSEGNTVTYLGVGQSDRGILTLKDQVGDTKINISSNENGGYFKANDMNNDESVYIDNMVSKAVIEPEGPVGCP